MRAAAEQTSRVAEATRRAEIVVGVRGGIDPGDAERAAHRIGRQLTARYADRPAVVLLLSQAGVPAPARVGGVDILPWAKPGQEALEATLRAAEAFDARAVAVVGADDAEEGPTDAARHLVAPVLEDGVDLVVPCYATHRFEGVLSTGVVYPLLRALFGKRLRQPLAGELAISRGLAGHLLGEAWDHDRAHAGEATWLAAAVLASAHRVAQVHLGPRPRRPETAVDLAASLAQVVGGLFHEMRLLAPAWQRVKGTRAVPTLGEPLAPPGDAGQPQVAPMIAAFQLGYQELGRLWGAVLPPRTLLALKALARAPEEAFALDDGLWARIVYDFAVAYHLASMDRALLLRSMTPLYLGWAASFAREVRDLDAAAVEARVERLCRAYEALKPYLIQRWRWPDRFNP